MNIFKNILGHAKSTTIGLITALGAAGAAGITGAATQFGQSGQTTDWKPYAAAAVAAAVPALVGAFSTDPAAKPALSESAQKAAAAIEAAGTAYAARKAEEVIVNLQRQLEQQ